MIYISYVLDVMLIYVLHFLNSISSFFNHFSAHIQCQRNRNLSFLLNITLYSQSMYITQIHRILDCSVIVKKMHSAHVQLLSCRYPIMLYHYGPQISLENLFFLSSKFCDSQTPNDKIVGKTQGNVYFFSVNGYQTSNTNYHTLLKSPLSPFFNVDICKA